MTEKIQDEFSDYDDIIAAVNADNRVGYHDFMVTDNSESSHPKIDNGEPFRKITGVLDESANKAKLDFIFTRVLPKDELEALKAIDAVKHRMTVQNIEMQRDLLRIYGKKAATLEAGDIFRVNIVKTKGKDGGNGFPRVVAVLPKDAVQVKKAPKVVAAKDGVPF